MWGDLERVLVRPPLASDTGHVERYGWRGVPDVAAAQAEHEQFRAVLAAAGATVAGYFLAHEVFNLKYSPDPMVWIVGTLGGALLVGIAGVLAARSVVTQPPVATLRQAQ